MNIVGGTSKGKTNEDAMTAKKVMTMMLHSSMTAGKMAIAIKFVRTKKMKITKVK